MKPLILSVDQGTTNTKALLVGTDGHAVFRASSSLAILHPRPGYVEQDPCAIWNSVERVIAECLAFLNQNPVGSIRGISISNQRETAVAWERGTARPSAPAIGWQCRRSSAICENLEPYSDIIRNKSGLPLDPLLSATKWAWMLQEIDGLAERARAKQICFGTVDSWLIYLLTGGASHCCDASNASRTALQNLKSLAWDTELLALFEIPSDALPEIHPSSGIFGYCTAIQALQGVPIITAIGDSHSALIGHGTQEPGTVKATYGTGSSLMTLTPSFPEPDKRLASTVAWSEPNGTRYALEGNISMSGAAIQWVGKFLGLPDPIQDTLALATRVPDSATVLFVPAMVGLAAPHWNSEARGTISGLNSNSSSAHLARAAVEAIAFQIRDVFEAMEQAAGVSLPALHADGGATGNDELMQVQADLLGRPVIRSACEDLSALGAAWLGGLALGWWQSTAEFASLPSPPTTFHPHLTQAAREARYDAWQTAVQRTLMRSEGK